MQLLRAGLTLALGAGLGAAAESWWRQRADARATPGLLSRLPVLPVAAAWGSPLTTSVPASLTEAPLSCQVPHLNQNAWNNLEKYSRSLTRTYQNVYVCTGPLFLPRTEADGKSYVKYQVIGKNHVAVPTHFFKVLILEAAGGQIELRSYVMPNAPVDEAIPLEHFLVPIESIERASGLLFVPNILARAGSLKAITAGSK
ncbi:PREDICTED: endonuclease G, mitochondrial [Bison bison bison]|uniref:Endonuclease G, mitochondrial n=1 Tax=Bison bison bison TaxID=43346 RepID=A0A6P3ILU3_BISBB|nr:PREDICTED: endonuclease G, mitochondrial [Bison bison bison]